jgi:hypothetical protein
LGKILSEVEGLKPALGVVEVQNDRGVFTPFLFLGRFFYPKTAIKCVILKKVLTFFSQEQVFYGITDI